MDKKLNKFVMRKIEKKDLQTRVEWINDPRIYMTMNIPVPVTLKSTLKWFERCNNDKSRNDLVLERNNEVVAMEGLYNRKNDSAELYTFVNPELKGLGIGTIARFVEMVWGFEIFKLEEITSIIDINNLASIRSFERAGFKLLKIEKNELEKQGQLIDRCYYALKKKDFDFSRFSYSIKGKSLELEIYG